MTNEGRGCLAQIFGFGRPKNFDASAGEEGNYHSGPGGYEGMGYSGGYAAEYRAEQEYFDDSDLEAGEEH